MLTQACQVTDLAMPGVSGNELKSVTFHKSRDRTWRLDTAPFYVIYPAVIIAALSSAFSGTGSARQPFKQASQLAYVLRRCKHFVHLQAALVLVESDLRLYTGWSCAYQVTFVLVYGCQKCHGF